MGAGAAREEDQAGAVGEEALDISSEGGGGEVSTAGVNANADCWGEFAGDFGFLIRYRRG